MSRTRSSSVWRAWYTLYYHRPGQLLRRLRKQLLPPSTQPLVSSEVGRTAKESAPRVFRELLDNRARRHAAELAPSDIRQGRLHFLGTERALGWPLDWSQANLPGIDHLWQFQLHYHEFLFDLLADDSHRTATVWEIVSGWIDAFPGPTTTNVHDAWHPFCISRRIPVWMMAWYASPPGPQVAETIAQSILVQVHHLAANLERDVGGNHLLENMRALALAAVFFDGPCAQTWLDTVETTLLRELPEQVLPSGEHFERTPTYHVLVLELLCDIRDALVAVRGELAARLDETIARMSRFLEEILHPDGDIPLLADSAFSATPLPSKVVARSGRTLSDAHEWGAQVVGDYWRYRDDSGAFVLFDGGPVAADHLPAHGHCDLLTLEASFAGKRIIVDGGVFDYGDTDMRRYCRGTSAHNVMQVGGANQCDVWSRFRMGYRGRPTKLRDGFDGGFHWAQAAHDAYRPHGVPQVVRWLGCRPGVWVCVDWALGSARMVKNRIRVHPDFVVSPHGTAEYQLETEGTRAFFAWAGSQEHDVRVEPGWYCPDFGTRHAVDVLTWEAKVPCVSVWTLSAQPAQTVITTKIDQSGLRVTYIPSGEELLVPVPLEVALAQRRTRVQNT